MCLGIIDLLAYINLVENIPTHIRGFVSSFILIFFPLGEFIISIFGYFNLTEGDSELNFTWLLVVPFTTIACMVILIIFIQESPRKIFAEDNIAEGVDVIQKITLFNKDDSFVNKKERILKELKIRRVSSRNILDVIQSKKKLSTSSIPHKNLSNRNETEEEI